MTELSRTQLKIFLVISAFELSSQFLSESEKCGKSKSFEIKYVKLLKKVTKLETRISPYLSNFSFYWINSCWKTRRISYILKFQNQFFYGRFIHRWVARRTQSQNLLCFLSQKGQKTSAAFHDSASVLLFPNQCYS